MEYLKQENKTFISPGLIFYPL